MFDFGKRVKYLREQKGLTQAQLASRLSVTRSLISAYEAGSRYPSLDMLIMISQSFHISTDYLLGINSEKTISLDGLTESQTKILYNLISEFKK